MFKELLGTEQLAELGPGRREGVLPEAEIRKTLAECFRKKALGTEPQYLITSLILLWHDHMDSSHTIAQGIPSIDGSYVHGMMHRREPDYWNSKYWFRRVGSHPAFPEIAKRAGVLLEGKSHEELRKKLLPEGKWDAVAFIDACESAAKSRDPGGTALLQKIQAVEFEVLLERFTGGEEPPVPRSSS
jgi:hypothetical protein